MIPVFQSSRFVLSLVAIASLLVAPSEGVAVEYNRDVRPILADYCFNCHGADGNARKAKLRLDTRDGALAVRSAGRAVIPGDPENSLLIKRIFSEDADERMPPSEHPMQLDARQKSTLREWITEGAAYQGHWAFVAPKPSPDTPAGDVIDQLVNRELKAHKMIPAKPARRETQLRRLSLDLTGLPPTAPEIDTFLKDATPAAYERVVDRLLQSDRFGERMAMWWLDGARYADSHGFQADWERYQWPWRDWVIKAFNSNLPFDQFTIEQLAGDLLPAAKPDQIVATGFNRNHRINTEGGSIDAEWLVENVIDRVETMGSVWLGLTLGCARCHDHKYDPISQQEFYELFAFFHNIKEPGKGPGKQGNFEPTLKLPADGQTARLAELDAKLKSATAETKRLEKRIPEFVAALSQRMAAEGPAESEVWELLSDATVTSVGGKIFTQQGDGSFLASGANPAKDVYTFTTQLPERTLGALMLEALPDPSLKSGGFGRSVNGNIVLSEFTAEIRAAKTTALKFTSSKASYSQSGYPIERAIDGSSEGGWAIDGQKHKVPRQAVFALETPLRLAGDLKVQLSFQSKYGQHAIERFRIFVSEQTTAPLQGESAISPELKQALATAVAKRSKAQKARLVKHIRENEPELVKAGKTLADLKKQRLGIEKAIPTVMVMREMEKPRATHILNRGQYDQPGKRVYASLPAAFPAAPKGTPMNRLGLAKWIVSPTNPLTARVQVNRIWELLFGVGLVKSSENFGTQADMPSHPELLDWLATEFIRLDWDQKALIKTIVMSAPYRRSANGRDADRIQDPENRWLSRGPRFRIQAEMVRDQALILGGLLNEKLGGPSVYPYQPEGIWSEFNFYGNLRNYKHALDENLYRRSLYTIWKRTAAPPAMTLFDMPSREICTVKRPRTNTPLQALALMNDVTYVEASRGFAERLLKLKGSPRAQISHGFKLVTSRAPRLDEISLLSSGYERRLTYYRENPDAAKMLLEQGESKVTGDPDPASLAAMTTTANVLLNLDETITR
jgi:hypothetical protein